MELETARKRARAKAALPVPRRAKALRVAAGVTVAEMADLVGVSPKTIEWWEAAKRRPTGIRVVRYAEVLGALAEELGRERGALS
jgi:transcriptional regulator with XRE-family HTH domain